ncbi:unnamed protein product [Closterium sp. Naga37s-1]|nr:unnamed protein product [Closterium sp. Naga37s-1]
MRALSFCLAASHGVSRIGRLWSIETAGGQQERLIFPSLYPTPPTSLHTSRTGSRTGMCGRVVTLRGGKSTQIFSFSPPLPLFPLQSGWQVLEGSDGRGEGHLERLNIPFSPLPSLPPFPRQSDWQVLEGSDGEGGKAFCRSVAVSAPKIRLMRSADISAGRTLQVLNLIAFPRPEYDLPYFCADLVTFPRGHLIVLDLNPLHQSEEHFSKYIAPIMPIANKYIEHLPWGGEFTAESLQFFSPALLWAKLPLDADVTAHVLPAFKEYLQAWLRMVETCEPTTDPAVMAHNMESQHRYICWRSVKDPGRPLLTRLFGSERCEEVIEGFLFAGSHELGTKGLQDYSAVFLNPPPPKLPHPPNPPSIPEFIRIPVCGSHQPGSKGFQDYSAAPLNPPQPPNLPLRQEFIEGFLFAGSHELGSKGFLDYFPDYRQEDGSIAKKRSMKGKAYSSRPWDAHGKLIF